jgi:transcriptional regulator GlxA family with amidase domain
VSAIDAHWGIINAAHFSRLFRDTYGLALAEYRRLHLAIR